MEYLSEVAHFIYDFIDILFRTYSLGYFVSCLLIFALFYYIACHGYAWYKGIVCFATWIAGTILLILLFALNDLKKLLSILLALIISTLLAVFVYQYFEKIIGFIWFAVSWLISYLYFGVLIKAEGIAKNVLAAIIALLIALIVYGLVTSYTKPFIILLMGIVFGKMAGEMLALTFGLSDVVATILEILFVFLGIFNQIRIYGFLGSDKETYSEPFDFEAAYSRLLKYSDEQVQVDGSNGVKTTTVVSETKSKKKYSNVDSVTAWVLRTYDEYIKLLSRIVHWINPVTIESDKAIVRNYDDSKTSTADKTESILRIQQETNQKANKSKEYKSMLSGLDDFVESRGIVEKFLQLVAGAKSFCDFNLHINSVGVIVLLAGLLLTFGIVGIVSHIKNHSYNVADMDYYEDSYDDWKNDNNIGYKSDIIRIFENDSERLDEYALDYDRGYRDDIEGEFDVHNIFEESYGYSDSNEKIGYNDNLDFDEDSYYDWKFNENVEPYEQREFNENGEPIELDILRERVANEFESDFGTYTLSTNADVTIMYEWYCVGSYEGGRYYDITNNRFEIISEWEYDSMEDRFTINGKEVSRDEVTDLAERMAAMVYTL